jgi:chromosome segregation ATPase
MTLAENGMDGQLVAEIEELRGRFPRTQDLYREVCVLLFFRHGITPTANKLYQLVRKGSMSAPMEALQYFWETLRERSRVIVDHADLPEELKTVAGELVATLWKTAQTLSRDALAQFRADAAAAVEAARAEEDRAKSAHKQTSGELERNRAELAASNALVAQLRQDMAAAEATKAGLEGRIEDYKEQLRDAQAQMERISREHAAERQALAEGSRLAEERFADMEKRALLAMDRERTAATKLQRTLENERAEHAKHLDRLRSDHNETLASVGALREQFGALQQANVALREERERALSQERLARDELSAATREAAAAMARAEQAALEVERLRKTVSAQDSAAKEPGRAAKTGTTKRRRKAVAEAAPSSARDQG